ncbi:MAG: amphi-Trp domain-containing protein [Phycisphaerales bacterium]|nr:amphi-Trp domain-containing protein [Phycisphaerales bacterium]
MAGPSDKFEYESMQDQETITSYMKALVDGLSKGKISLASNGSEVLLTPKGLMRFSIEAKRSDSRSRFTVKISWREEEQPEDDLEIEVSHTPKSS